MWDIVIDTITSAAMQAALILLPVLLASLFGWLIEKYGLERLRKIREQYEQKQGWAYMAVQAAQQLYGANNGAEKYRYATAWLAARAREKGMPITADEIQGMIEAAVKACKAEFGEAWAEAGEDAEAG